MHFVPVAGDMCHTIEGGWHRHGEVFTMPGARCVKYRCEYGNFRIYEEGMQYGGKRQT
jgi:hypothetical protein